MALLNTITSSKGVTTTYHKVNEVTVHNGDMYCQVNSYVSKDYRDLERPADYLHFEFQITVEEEESMGIRQLAYKKIKGLPEWSEAVDC